MIRSRDLPLIELRHGGWVACHQNTAEAQESIPQQGIGPWSLVVHAGESICIEGPSGTGKTLLLHRLCQTPLAGLQPEGQLFWCGKPAPTFGISRQRWWKNEVRMVPQDVQSSLSPCLRVGQQLQMALRSSPLQQRGLQLHDLLEILELVNSASNPVSDLLELFPCQCSGGQRQRIGLLLGLLAAPRLLLLDEPSSALHASLAARLPGLVAELLPGTSCIWTTHDPILKASLQSNGTRCMVLSPPAAVTFPPSDPAPSQAPPSASPNRVAQAIQRCIGRVESLQVPLGKDLSLRVADRTIHGGQIIGWWGPSGIGKTSLARCVAGLLAPRSGRIWIESAYEVDNPEASFPCFLAFQNAFACFVSHRSLRQQLEEALASWPHRTDNLELERLWAELDLPMSRLDATPTELSGGQLQRAALVRALLLRPTLLVLDEPTAALDPSNRTRVANTLRAYVADGHRSVCIISHDRPWLMSLADDIWDLQEEACPEPDGIATAVPSLE